MVTTTTSLSPRQRQLVDAIERFTSERRYCPTLREIASVLQLSITRTKGLADEAERRGAITHSPRCSRSRPRATTTAWG